MNDNTLDPDKHDAGNLKPTPNSFTPGWCTFHVVQYQRDQNGVGGDYAFDLELFDGAQQPIGSIAKQAVDAATKSLDVPSTLPLTLVVTARGPDEAPVLFAYGDQSWDSDDQDAHHCTLGLGDEWGYEDGNREGDCGFTC